MGRRRLGSALALSLSVLLLGAGVADAATPIAASSVATGRGHTCAILTSGQVVCWGNNFYGELGNGTNSPSKTPVSVTGLTDAKSISSNGEYTTCAIRTGGQALCWGKNIAGQIGDGTKEDRNVPTPVTGLTDAKSISSGALHTCAIRESGQAVCWGANEQRPARRRQHHRAAHTRERERADRRQEHRGWAQPHLCGSRGGGEALCWGYDVGGVLGKGSPGGGFAVKVPGAVKGPGGSGTLGDITQVAVGETHSCALEEGGQMYCWGDNVFGRLGDDTTESKNAPVAVHDMADAKFISAGYASSCAIRESGQALCWGSNAQGRLGDGTEAERHVPTAVPGVGDAKYMSGKLGHMCAVRVSGETVCWGDNGSGQLGDGTEMNSLTPVVVVAGAAASTPPPAIAAVKTPVPKKKSGGKAKGSGKGYGKCLAQANKAYKKAVKKAKHKHGRAHRKALKAAKKKKHKLVGKCKKRFHKRKGKKKHHQGSARRHP